MTILSRPLRRQLENVIRQAREIAEAAAGEVIARIGVSDAEAPLHLSEDNKALRRRLRAHARTLGDSRDAIGTMTTARLQDEAAYQIWHRMLFGRFLAERGLLIHPDLGAAISVSELRELAQEEGVIDEWALAEQYAAPGLPGVFKPDDPVLALPVAPEFSQRLRAILSGLPDDVFTADDSLGWTYQFWRASEKDAVNQAGGKIGAAELPAVTQLFTESYMVKFLLHNALGAWWAGKVLAHDLVLASYAADEDTLREACALPGVTWEFLRFVSDNPGAGPWQPAAGTFPGWPLRAAEITYCDPCCGSGHFLVEAFFIIAALRQREEGLTASEAAVSVLRDNLHGLEIDGRCVQIAAFNVALAAWKLAGGPIPLPSPHIAWVGAPPPSIRTEMSALGNGDVSLCIALEALHDQFAQAPLLGSLLEVGSRDLLDVDLRERGDVALAKLRDTEPEHTEGAVAARGLFDAAALLSRRYVLLATNVPFLGRGKQEPALANYIASQMPEAKADLATAMINRMFGLCQIGGTLAVVSPQNWFFLSSYREFREQILRIQTINFLPALGEEAWEAFGQRGPLATLGVFTRTTQVNASHAALDATSTPVREDKINFLLSGVISRIRQASQQSNPDSRLTFSEGESGPLLNKFAIAPNGMHGADAPRFRQMFWEHVLPDKRWVPFQLTVENTTDFGGREHVFDWSEDGISHKQNSNARVQGFEAWGKQGICVSMMRKLTVTRYTGEHFDISCTPIVPNDPRDLPAIWAFCTSVEFYDAVRRIDTKVNVTNSTLIKVPFDIAQWQLIAAKRYPGGLPEPYSDDPTQWLFHGHPAFAVAGTELHIALARLAGYRWPAEIDATMRLAGLAKERINLAADLPDCDDDGLLPLHRNGTDLPLADRMRAMLAAAYRAPLSLAHEQALVRSADARFDKKASRDATIESWLAERAFRQHCILFQQRPILWHIWDGMKDGFSAFLHYHQLNRAILDKLTYTLLGDWIRTAKAEGHTAQLERAERLQQMLIKIIEGEKPFDIFVRWKSLVRQPIGWEPDLDDGVRLNIRPFMIAGILREQPKGISWNKDRGTDVASAPWFNLGPSNGGKNGDRINDHHTALAEKRAARETS